MTLKTCVLDNVVFFFKIAIACVCVILNERTMNHTATVIEHVTVCAMCYMGNEIIIYSVT